MHPIAPQVVSQQVTDGDLALTLDPKLRANSRAYGWSYRPPRGADAAPLRDLHGNEASSFGSW